MQLYAEACYGFPLGVVEYVLRHIRLRNPRNPFAPTSQDVHELCASVQRRWKARLVGFYIEHSDDTFTWGKRSYLAKPDPWLDDWGPKPGDPGCYMTEAMIVEVLRAELAHEWHRDRLVNMPSNALERIPVEGFPDGVRDTVVELRRQAAEKAEEDRRFKAYLDGLEPAIRAARRKQIGEDISRGKRHTKDELIELAGERVAREERDWQGRMKKRDVEMTSTRTACMAEAGVRVAD
jgi:hypothetical protein